MKLQIMLGKADALPSVFYVEKIYFFAG